MSRANARSERPRRRREVERPCEELVRGREVEAERGQIRRLWWACLEGGIT